MSVFFLLHKVTVPYLIKDPHYTNVLQYAEAIGLR